LIPSPGAALGRDVTIDVARGIAIVFVVLGHSHAVSSAAPALVAALFLFHVPFFFLLSGLVQRAQPLGVAAMTLARRLLLPFLLAALCVGVTKSLTREMSFGHTLAGIAWGTGQTLPWSHLWFLPALFLALLVTQVVRLVPGATARWAVACGVAMLMVLFIPPLTGPDLEPLGFAPPVGLPWSLDLLPACLLFVWSGAMLRENSRARAMTSHPLFVAGCAVLFVLSLSARVDLNLRVFSPPALAITAAFSGCVLALALARALAKLRPFASVLATVGRHTLLIFLLHVSIQKELLGWFTDEHGSRVALLLAGLVTAAAAIAVCLAISMLWDGVRARMQALPAREVAT
jgi:fucose 4-O-acetylase-like acetyltransferase